MRNEDCGGSEQMQQAVSGQPCVLALGLGRHGGLPVRIIDWLDCYLQLQELLESNKSLIANPRDFLDTVNRCELAILFAVIKDSFCFFGSNIRQRLEFCGTGRIDVHWSSWGCFLGFCTSSLSSALHAARRTFFA